MLRFSIANEYLKLNAPEKAAEHFSAAVEKDPLYSAAWKLLGKALSDSGRLRDAAAAWKRGIEVAESRGDKQAAKEMQVFAKRLEKNFGRRCTPAR